MSQQEEKYRVSMSYSELQLLIHYIQQDKENILENASFLRRLEKQAKKISFGLLDPAYIAATPTAGGAFVAQLQKEQEISAGKLARDKLGNGLQLSDTEEDDLATYLLNHLSQEQETFTKEEKAALSNFMARKMFAL